MSANRPSRHHGFRGYGAADHDRLKRALLQPVQSWERKWSNGKSFKIMKWVKSDRKITFNDDDDDDGGGVATPARQPIIEDTPTPTASIIQPPTEASTPQPSETEPDTTSFLRPLPHLSSIPKAPSLLREASLTSAVSTPGETITTNNNNTPRDLESSINSPEEGMDDDDEQMDDIIASQSIPQKNNDGKMKFGEVIKQVNDNIDLFNKQASGGSSVFNENQNEYVIREKPNNYDEDDQPNDDEDDDDDDDDDDDEDDEDDDDEDDEDEEDEEVVNRFIPSAGVAYNGQTEGYSGQGEDYSDVQVEDYNENDDDDDYGEGIGEFGNQGDDDYIGGRTSEYVDRISEYETRNSEYGGNTSEYGGSEYIGRTSEYGGQNEDVYGTLSDFDEPPNEYPHTEYREQQVCIQGQISEYTDPPNPYQEQKVNEFTEHDKGKNTQEDDVEQD